MRRELIVFSIAMIFAVSFVSAQSSTCTLDVELINQDPYPAIPGDYVKIVFQLNGIGDPTCGEVEFELLPEFPFSLDPGVPAKKSVSSGTFARKYESFAIIPYQLRVDGDALDGANPLEVSYSKGGAALVKQFDIEIDDVRTDFEISVEDYVLAEREITFEILNIGENDVEALTVEIPKQDNLDVKGSNREVIGDLDSNEATSFSFEATPSDGEINLKIYYTDSVNVRREIEKTIVYDSSYFTGRLRDEKSTSAAIYVLAILFVLIVVWRVNAAIKKKKKEKLRREEMLARNKK